MNFSDLFFFLLSGIYAFLEIRFVARFSNIPIRKVYYALFLLFSLSLSLFDLYFGFGSGYFFMLLTIALLFIFGFFLFKIPPALCVVAALLAVTVVCLVNGMINSISGLLNSSLFLLVRNISLFPATSMILGVLSIPALFATYRCIEKNFLFRNKDIAFSSIILFIPLLLILLVTQFISSDVYGNVMIVDGRLGRIAPQVNDVQMLVIQSVAYGGLLAILFAFHKLSENARMETQIALLTQQLSSQKEYMREAQSRYDNTRAFRHDLKSHLLVLNGLLQKGNLQKAQEYLSSIDEISREMCLIYQTGNPVIDILFGSKLAAARQIGIEVECRVKIPSPSPVDEMDLCIVFSNAIDNAIKACTGLEQASRICISGRQQGDFFLIEVENSFSAQTEYPHGSGLGLKNIEAIARKYHGAVNTEIASDLFHLSVLFIISHH